MKKVEFKFTPEKDTWDGIYLFGGTIGVTGVIIYSHFVMYYFWVCIEFYQGNAVYPGHPLLANGVSEIFEKIREHAAPTLWAWSVFTGFLVFEYALAVLLPGPITEGLAIPSENGRKLQYCCNGLNAWYVILTIVAAAHFSGVFPL
jgi:delta24(24(1))-sterol reductase